MAPGTGQAIPLSKGWRGRASLAIATIHPQTQTQPLFVRHVTIAQKSTQRGPALGGKAVRRVFTGVNFPGGVPGLLSKFGHAGAWDEQIHPRGPKPGTYHKAPL